MCYISLVESTCQKQVCVFLSYKFLSKNLDLHLAKPLEIQQAISDLDQMTSEEAKIDHNVFLNFIDLLI